MNISSITNIVHPIRQQIENAGTVIGELQTDSRKVSHPEETLFFAILTRNNDGHRYIAKLMDTGVRNFIISDPEQIRPGGNFLCVSNVIDALQAIARVHREQFHYPVIGITGSNGKTIVKEWLATLLSDCFNLVKSPDSYNSQLGVPLSVWRMGAEHNLAVFETGISQPGEMQRLAEIVKPNIGILTNIGMAHAQYFTNIPQKIQEKLRLFKHADMLIYRDDNELVNQALQEPTFAKLRKISWGSEQASYPVQLQREGNTTLLTIGGNNYHIPFVDAASIENATHVIVTALTLGIKPQAIDQRLSRLTRISMRTEILEGNNHSIIINDTYSLDTNSLNAALDFLNTQTQLSDRTIILSDFEQVGQLNEQWYRDLNEKFHQHNIHKLIAVGQALGLHQQCFDMPVNYFYNSTEDLLDNLPEFSYEAILVKGARNFHFEQVVARLQHKTHLTILNISLPAIAHNLQYHRSFLKPETKMVAMVKAHCYGLGDVELVNELVQRKIDYLAVAYTDEGVRLRKRHIQTPIIVLGAEAHSFDVMVQHQLEPEIFNFYYLQELENVLERHPEIERFNIHLKMDTGMHRLGFDEQDIPKLIQTIQRNPKLHIASIFSHLAASEDSNEDAYTLQQIEQFRQMTDPICKAFNYQILRHILNSSGIVRFTEHCFDMVRLGIGLYGCSEIPEVAENLQNVVTLKSVITQVKTIQKGETIGYNRSYMLERDTKVAIVPIGYADGYPRELANGRGKMIIRGQKVPVIGKICMDMCMVDVTGLSIHEGDEVIVYGEGNTVAEMAKKAGLISYELLTRISQRVPRVYVRE